MLSGRAWRPHIRFGAGVGIEIEYLVVAGGGGGGDGDTLDGNYSGQSSGDGGAGGALTGSFLTHAGQSMSVTVGTGGSAGGGNGGNSTLYAFEAIGGGGGGDAPDGSGSSGGSGGGGAENTGPGGAGTEGQGTAGKAGNAVSNARHGGGLEISSSITGASVTYASPGRGSNVDGPDANTGDGGEAEQSAGSAIIVTGAGVDTANGRYQRSGEIINGREAFRNENAVLLSWKGSDWHIGVGADTYYILDDTSDPPATPSGSYRQEEWPGQGPAPSILGRFGPNAGASGVVVIAYPDTFPALTIGSGLTYDEPSRSGYRVYRFTGGSGTVTFP